MCRLWKHTTEALLTFDDKYGENADNTDLRDFKQDLSKLGETLEIRFKLEDRLVVVLQMLDDILAKPNKKQKD